MPTALFTPGMFGRIRVPGSPPYTALLVPDAAIGTEQARKYVLVVGDDGDRRAEIRDARQLDDGLRVVKDGLDADDRVIVNGLMRARAGMKVECAGARRACRPQQRRRRTRKDRRSRRQQIRREAD